MKITGSGIGGALGIAVLSAASLVAQENGHPTGTRITPPTLVQISPQGAARGTSFELVLEGFNLAGASQIYFSDPQLKGKIRRVKELPDQAEVRLGSNGTVATTDLGPLPPRHQVTVDVDIPAGAEIGDVSFRLLTPLGTSPEGRILVEPFFGEAADKEPNDLLRDAAEAILPAVLVGTISRNGDVDHFTVQVAEGQELSFDNGANLVGSTLQPVVAILSEEGKVLAEFGYDGGRSTNQFSYKFGKAGKYVVRITDYEKSGRASHTYRIKMGEFPVVSSAWPLGMRQGQSAEIALSGPRVQAAKVTVQGKADAEEVAAMMVRPKTAKGLAFNRIKLAVGEEPEVISANATTVAAAQGVSVPVTINGRIDAAPHHFRFSARKGQQLALEVNARRLGSDLDSLVEILDAAGKPVVQAVLRPAVETFVTLRDHDSAGAGIRLTHWNGFEVGDYVLLGREVARVAQLPFTPDNDTIFDSFGGQRLAFLNTTSQALANDKAVYKVQVAPAGTKFTPNGMPITTLTYRNDDGGPGYGKDSYVAFTAPADGDYIAVLRDVNGLGGQTFGYRLTIREPRADFRLSVSPRNPNVPFGGSIPVTVSALRMDGFDGPIEVTVKDLPAGVTATKATILPGQRQTVILLSAAANATFAEAKPFVVEGQAAKGLVRFADAADKTKLVSLMPVSDVTMVAETKVVELAPGERARVKVRIARHNGFAGRVPVEVFNLPPRTKLADFGLNGVLLNENETERSFLIEASPSAEPVEQQIVVGGRVETRAGGQQTIFAAPEPILVRIRPKQQVTAADKTVAGRE